MRWKHRERERNREKCMYFQIAYRNEQWIIGSQENLGLILRFFFIGSFYFISFFCSVLFCSYNLTCASFDAPSFSLCRSHLVRLILDLFISFKFYLIVLFIIYITLHCMFYSVLHFIHTYKCTLLTHIREWFGNSIKTNV